MRLRTVCAVVGLTVAAALALSGCASGSKAPASKGGASSSTEATKGPALPAPTGDRFADTAAAASALDFTPATPTDAAAGKLLGVWVDTSQPKENRPAVLSFDTGMQISASLTEERAIASEGGNIKDAPDPSTMVPRLEQTKEPPDYGQMVQFFADEKTKGIYTGSVPELIKVNGHDGITGTRKVGTVTVSYVDWHDGTAFYRLQYPGDGLKADQLIAIANSMY